MISRWSLLTGFLSALLALGCGEARKVPEKEEPRVEVKPAPKQPVQVPVDLDEEARKRDALAKAEIARKAEAERQRLARAEIARKAEDRKKAEVFLANLKERSQVAQKEAEQAKEQAKQDRKKAEGAAEDANKAQREYLAAKLAQSRLGTNAVKAGSAEAARRVQAYQDTLAASGKAADAKQIFKDLSDKARDSEEKAQQAAVLATEARAAVRKAELDLLRR